MCRINYHLLKCVESETDLRQWFRSQNSNSAPFLGLSPDILKWNKILIDEGLVDLLQDVHPFCHFSKHSMNSIQVVQVLPCGHEKLKEDFWSIKDIQESDRNDNQIFIWLFSFDFSSRTSISPVIHADRFHCSPWKPFPSSCVWCEGPSLHRRNAPGLHRAYCKPRKTHAYCAEVHQQRTEALLLWGWPVDGLSTTTGSSGVSSLSDEVSLKHRGRNQQTHCISIH